MGGNKDYKTMLLPLMSVLAIGVGAIFKLSEQDVATLQSSLEQGLAVVLTIIGLFGIVKTHDKDKNKEEK